MMDGNHDCHEWIRPHAMFKDILFLLELALKVMCELIFMV